MNEKELYDKLEQYVRGKLPPDETTALERDMAHDPDLREQVRLHRLELESQEYLLREKLRTNVRDWIAEAPPPEPPSSIWKTWGLPLSLIAFVVVGLWVLVPILKKNTTPGSQPVEQKSNEGDMAPPASKPDHRAQPLEQKKQGEKTMSPISTPNRPVAQEMPQKRASEPPLPNPSPLNPDLAGNSARLPLDQRPRIAVANFDISRTRAQGNVGNEIAFMLASALSKTERFNVDKSLAKIGGTTSEINFNQGGAIDQGDGTMKDAQLVITGELTEFLEEKIHILGEGRTKATIGIALKIVDPKTREVLWSKIINKKVTKEENRVFNNDIPMFSSKAMDDAVEKAIIEAANLVTGQNDLIQSHTQPIGYLALAETNYRLPTHLDGGDLKSDGWTDSATGPLAAGIRAFQSGRYQTAIRELSRVKEAADSDEYLQAREWLAHAWFKHGIETRDFSQAADHFQRLTKQKDNDAPQQDRAEWYLLLSLLPDYPKHKARVDTLLQNILAVKDHSYYSNAKRVQEELKEMK